jgi:hypothetical protein
MEKELEVGNRVKLSGGYDYEPRWLSGAQFYLGSVTAFIPGQNQESAAVVALDAPIDIEGVVGNTVVLELRYVGQEWAESGTVHVELCDFEPEPKRWQERQQGKWVESNATYERVP